MSIRAIVHPNECSNRRLHSVKIHTPLGVMRAIADDARLALLEFADRRALPTEIAWLRRHFGVEVAPGRNAVLEQIERELSAYFGDANMATPASPSAPPLPLGEGQGERDFRFSTPIALVGTPFQVACWRQLLAIPHGQTRSYADIARAIDNPSAVRAVGRANGANRLAIIIPCHRVVRSDGALCGYGGGRWRKQWLLDHERDDGLFE